MDKYFAHEKLNANEETTKSKYNEIWKQLIEKIDSLEKEYQNIGNKRRRHTPENETATNRLEPIQQMLNSSLVTDFVKIHELIQNEEKTFLAELFRNKTIAFVSTV